MALRRKRRKFGSTMGWTLGWIATALVLFSLADMVGTIILKGVASFRWNMLWTVTSGEAGGLENAILGTFELIIISIILAGPLGVLGGIFTSEFASKPVAKTIRFLTEVLSGVPSIVIGYFGYLLMVLQWGWGFSPIAGGIALTIIMLPYILRNTEASLQQVPLSLREAAWGLGMTRFQAVYKVIWRPAAGGMATGILMAIAIGMGETAPLLYTAGWSSLNPTWQLTHHQLGYLTYIVWTYIDMPYTASHQLAYSAAFVLLVIVLVINIAVRALVTRPSLRR
ncbi:phosphate ABC transporter permease PstA [Alicyclobacillus ferrooxydans]|uniref:Phosphate transport system permease protein PstA n=1 Tax=Alicyclobacillus ferrooxydans TaxID=471514 RepID=A0A0P9EHT0_9BACL|nr:phosphate ABC transporter permease PstA [Alicyclobacillus ferrooxydans]KPV42254.1 phosphate ABC transporter permease [Alicyclobacillus ferrooxydans]